MRNGFILFFFFFTALQEPQENVSQWEQLLLINCLLTGGDITELEYRSDIKTLATIICRITHHILAIVKYFNWILESELTKCPCSGEERVDAPKSLASYEIDEEPEEATSKILSCRFPLDTIMPPLGNTILRSAASAARSIWLPSQSVT